MARESKSARTARAGKIIAGLMRAYPDAHCELNYSNPLELLIATILSAQCTDKRVNLVTAELFKKYRSSRPRVFFATKPKAFARVASCWWKNTAAWCPKVWTS